MASSDPRGYFFKAMTYYYRFQYARMGGANKQQKEEVFQRFTRAAQRVTNVCEQLLASNPKDAKVMFYLGGLHGYRGLAAAMNNDFTKALWYGKKGYDMLSEAVKLDPQNADAQMGLGLFNYLISQTPAIMRGAVKLASLSGNKNEGLRQLEFAAANGIYARAEAQYWLAGFYSGNGSFFSNGENLPERSEKFYKAFIVQYPKNALARYFYGRMLISNLRRADDAMKQFQEASDDVNGPGKLFAATSSFQLGLIQMKKQDYATAITTFQRALSLSKEIGQSWDAIHESIGLCYDLQGKRVEANAAYQKAGDDKDAKERLAKPLTEADMAAMKAGFAFDVGDYDKSAAACAELLKRGDLTNDIRGYASYYAGRTAFERNDFRQAEAQLAQAVNTQPQKPNSLLPAAHYWLGMAQAKLGKTGDAVASLDQADAFKNYEGESTLRQRIEREKARLKRQ
jgi:Flp pilus assembly protein TadD